LVSGELDLADSDGVAKEVCDLLDRGFAEVVLDLRGLTFIDSSGIHALLACTRHARERRSRLTVVLGAGPIARAIELCGVRELLDIAPESAAA
jgi:anti-sigma B factor antagonist